VAARLNEPYAPKQPPTLRGAIDGRLRRALPAPAYELLRGGYNRLRIAARRNPGRGRVLPDFVIIGAAKAGTTSLFGWLLEHPFVRGSARKETNYFSHYYSRGEDWYRIHFPLESEREAFAAEHGRPFLTGEASPSYLLHVWAPERMAKHLPDARLIVQLRDPVDRAYSQYQMRRRDGEEPLDSFEAAVDAEEGRLAAEHERMLGDRRYSSYEVACWSYLMRSRYAEQLERWFRYFPRERIHILSLESLAADPGAALDAVHEFLGLPRHRPAELDARFVFDYDPMSPETRARLERYFEPHNERLYELVGTDFGWGRDRQGQSAAVAGSTE
jgi:Sulfotransferase domain